MEATMKRVIRSSINTAVIAFLASGASEAVVTQRPPRLPSPAATVNREAGRFASPERWRKDTLLVGFKPDVSAASAAELHEALGSERIREFPELRLHVVRLKDGVSVEEAVHRYAADSRVAYAEPDYLVSAQATPNDPLFS